jgi:hypothetical protein
MRVYERLRSRGKRPPRRRNFSNPSMQLFFKRGDNDEPLRSRRRVKDFIHPSLLSSGSIPQAKGQQVNAYFRATGGFAYFKRDLIRAQTCDRNRYSSSAVASITRGLSSALDAL